MYPKDTPKICTLKLVTQLQTTHCSALSWFCAPKHVFSLQRDLGWLPSASEIRIKITERSVNCHAELSQHTISQRTGKREHEPSSATLTHF